jgi:PAS domain S-box-containing protein
MTIRRYGWALALAGVALAVAWLLGRAAGPPLGFLVFIVAVTFSGFFGGAGPGLVTTLLLAGAHLLLMQRYGLGGAQVSLAWFGTGLFAVAGITISVLSGAFHRTRRRLDAALEDSKGRARQLEREMDTRRKAETNLTESDERYRTFLQTSSEAIWRAELDPPVPVSVSEEEQTALFFKSARMAECNEVFARMYGFSWPSEMAGLPFTRVFERFHPEVTNLVRLFLSCGHRLLDAASVEKLEGGEVRHVLSNWAGVVRHGRLLRVWGTQRDLTGMRQIQERIQESENRFRQLAENIREAFYMWSVRPVHVLYVSPAAEEIAGCDGARFYHRPALFLRLVHSRDRRQVLEAIQRQVRGEPTEIEYRIRRPDRTVRWIYDRAFPIRNPEGQVYRVAGIAEDITERKQAQARTAIEHAVTKALARARNIEEAGAGILRSMQGILEAQAATIWLIDGETGLLRCSLVNLTESSMALEEFAAVSCATSFARGVGLPGRVWASCQPALIPDLAEDTNFPRAQVASSAGLSSGIAFPILTGTEFTGVMEFFTRHPLVPDQALLRMMGIIGSEIGQFIHRRKAEADVQRLNRDLEHRVAELQTMMNVLPIGIAVSYDPLCRRITSNPALKKILGLPESEAAAVSGDASVPCKVFRGNTEVPASDLPLQKACRTGRQIIGDEITVNRADGSVAHMLVNAAPLFDEQGQVRGCLATHTDISERKQHEEALRQAQEALTEYAAQLEARVAERTVALEHSVTLLESFCYTIAHDLRAPLRSLEGFSQALIEDYSDKLDDVGQDYARRIIGAARRMSRLVEDLLAYGRLSSMELPCRPLDLEMQVDDIVEQFAHEIQQKKAEIRIARPLPEAWADPVVLNQVITNLFTNALKFVDSGKRPVIEFSIIQSDTAVRLHVKDNGIGIAPEYQERIFNVFERLHPAKFPGTGIGLAIVRKGVERMGGSCGVISEAGAGSTFWIELPKPQVENTAPVESFGQSKKTE